MNCLEKPEKSKSETFCLAEVQRSPQVPPLKLTNSPKITASTSECPTLTSRIRQRNSAHRSLDFSLITKSLMPEKVIKADHTIVSEIVQKSATNRKMGSDLTMLIQNRRVSRNLLLDSLKKIN